MGKKKDLWADNLIQFARLLAEINATQDKLDIKALCDSMDLEPAAIDELFERANDVWEESKRKHCPPTKPAA